METQTNEQVVFYIKPMRTGEEVLVEWPLRQRLGEGPGGSGRPRLATPTDFEVGDRVMYEVTTDEDYEQETGTVIATNAIVVSLNDGRLATIEWGTGRLNYIARSEPRIRPATFTVTTQELEKAFEKVVAHIAKTYPKATGIKVEVHAPGMYGAEINMVVTNGVIVIAPLRGHLHRA